MKYVKCSAENRKGKLASLIFSQETVKQRRTRRHIDRYIVNIY